MASNFLDKYVSLAIGRSLSIKCPHCSRNSHKKSAGVLRIDDGVMFHCFKCGDKTGLFIGKPTLKQRLAKLAPIPKSIKIPEDFTLDMHIDGKVKMFKYGITDEMLRLYNIGYSSKLHAIVYPLYDVSGLMTAIQYRRLDEDTTHAKYISHGVKPVYYCYKQNSNTLVITEDVLSAIKVSEYANSLCLLGTELSTDHIKFILKYKFKEVIIWLDNDKGGKDGERKTRKRLNMHSINTRSIFSDRDPKDAMHKEIQQHLKGE